MRKQANMYDMLNYHWFSGVIFDDTTLVVNSNATNRRSVVLMKEASSGEQSNNVSFNLLTLKISKVILTTHCHKLHLVMVMRICYIQSNSFIHFFISVILTICLLNSVFTLQGENTSWSFLRVKELNDCKGRKGNLK